jgi:hypothetical protein
MQPDFDPSQCRLGHKKCQRNNPELYNIDSFDLLSHTSKALDAYAQGPIIHSSSSSPSNYPIIPVLGIVDPPLGSWHQNAKEF